eukprot:7383513-Prymnesium_polylepis.1
MKACRSRTQVASRAQWSEHGNRCIAVKHATSGARVLASPEGVGEHEGGMQRNRPAARRVTGRDTVADALSGPAVSLAQQHRTSTAQCLHRSE